MSLFKWPNIWSILENVLSTLEKNVYSILIGGNVLCMFFSFGLSCCSSYFCLDFFPDIIDFIGVSYWFPTNIVELPISPFGYCFICFGTLVLCVYMFIIVISSLWIDHFLQYTKSLSSVMIFVLKSISSDICIATSWRSLAVLFEWSIYFILFTFNVFVLNLDLKWVSIVA